MWLVAELQMNLVPGGTLCILSMPLSQRYTVVWDVLMGLDTADLHISNSDMASAHWQVSIEWDFACVSLTIRARADAPAQLRVLNGVRYTHICCPRII